MPQRREHPYIWATWLPRLLTGENSCEWAIWFKAHHQSWERVPSDFDQAKWILDHTALLNERIANWTVGGHDVDIEAQNRFELHGRTATLAGRPDIIARREDHAVIVDAKTGHDSPRPRRPGHDLPVRRPQGTPAVPEREAQGTGHIPGPHGPHFGRGRRRPVHPEPGRANPPDLGRRTRKTRAQPPGVPVLRHQRRRLSGPHGRRLRA